METEFSNKRPVFRDVCFDWDHRKPRLFTVFLSFVFFQEQNNSCLLFKNNNKSVSLNFISSRLNTYYSLKWQFLHI